MGKSIRSCFSDEELMSLIGIFEMYSTPLMNNAKVSLQQFLARILKSEA